MNDLKRRALPLLLALALLLPCLPAPAGAAAALPSVRCILGDGSTISLQQEKTDVYLFLPAMADLHKLTFSFREEEMRLEANEKTIALTSGEPADVAALFPKTPSDGVYSAVLQWNEHTLPVKIMKSGSVAALFLTSDDPARDRLWVEQDKRNKAKGSAVLRKEDGAVLYDGKLTQIKGRGNSTWKGAKKPYQIKLAQAADLMETDEPGKTWVLLSNYYDKTLLRNRIALDLAAEMGLACTSHTRPVDLYYDGAYRGSYLLTEKVEIAANRVDIRDLEEAFEKANEDIGALDSLPRVRGQTANGYPCQYVEGLNTPEDITGGYLLELDFPERLSEEASWFVSGLNQSVVCKSPKYLSKSGMDYICASWQRYEDAIRNGGVNPVTKQSYERYMDLPSLAKSYLLMELALQPDAYLSSTYFYKPEHSTKFYAGPLWDFDTSFGGAERVRDKAKDGMLAGNETLPSLLLQIPSFRQEAGRQSRTLHWLIRDILLNPDPAAHGTILRSLAGYEKEIRDSRRMDHVFWRDEKKDVGVNTTAYLTQFLSQREDWLYRMTQGWTPHVMEFEDVLASDWYAGAVEGAVKAGLFQGVTGREFRPESAMTRGMVAAVLYRMAGQPRTQGSGVFTDVPQGAWYASAVSWAAEKGVVTGYPDGTFQPDASVSRQELVSLMYRYAVSLEPDLAVPSLPDKFADGDRVPDWAADAFAWAVDSGLVNGSSAEGGELVLAPEGKALRSQGAALFLRLQEYLAKR